ncbi:MAG: hypothetical protein H7Y00_02710 [Fimbriimonadaceae bacterium]|nr:hypothetical protein [Chitinophagales bacterium]
MKKIIALVFIIACILTACTDKKKESAVVYNDTVVKAVDRADSVIQILFSFKMFEKFSEAQNGYNTTFTKSLNQLNSLQPIVGDDTLRQTAIELIETYKNIVNEDFGGIYKIMNDSAYTVTDSLRVDSLMAEMYSKWQVQSSNMATEQNDFAKRHGIILEK